MHIYIYIILYHFVSIHTRILLLVVGLFKMFQTPLALPSLLQPNLASPYFWVGWLKPPLVRYHHFS